MGIYTVMWGNHSATLDGYDIIDVSSRKAWTELKHVLSQTAVVRFVNEVPDDPDELPIIDERTREFEPGHRAHIYATLFLLDGDIVVPEEDIAAVNRAGFEVDDDGLPIRDSEN